MEFFISFILPTIILVVLAGLFAFLLSYMGDKFAVERDPKIDDVVRQLAGANCGGCGYAGCDGFACALVEGKADIDNCNPTSKENKNNIAKILGVSASEAKPSVAVVHCAGGNRCKDKYAYQGYGNCTSINMLSGGNKTCDWGCIGSGTCTVSCKYDAIAVDKDKGYAIVDDSKCISCGACVSSCPKKIISRIPKDAKVYIACTNTNKGKEVMDICEFGCIACGKCVRTCKYGAITLENNLSTIDYDKCTSCGDCARACPRKTIHIKDEV